MSAHRQQRLPLSCENCRRRKIRCFGDGTPCQPCIRRSVSSTCHFLRNQASRLPHTLQAETQTSLTQRIEALEDLVKENIDLTRRLVPITSSDAAIPNTSRVLPRQRGQLIHSTTGHVRYLCTQNTAAGFAQDSLFLDLPFSDMSVITHRELLDLLPPLSRCDELKDVFMDVFSPLFHILHDPTFEAEYTVFRQHPQDVKLTFLALIFVVLAIGVTALDESHSLLADLGKQASAGDNVRNIATRFRNAAMRTLTTDKFLWRHNLRTLQTLVLLIYALSHAHGPAWSLLGTTMHIAVAIGCHIDPSKYNVTVIEAEERRRCWAALLMLYTIQETALGIQAPFTIHADTRPPADIDDGELSVSASGIVLGASGPRPPSKMAYILRKFSLYHLAAEICSSVGSDAHDERRITRLDNMIESEEMEQQEYFAHTETLPLYHQAHYYILSSYTNHLHLILHSPILKIPSTIETHGRAQSMQRLCDASLKILTNYDVLRCTSSFQKYRWYTDGLGSFHAFLAASTLVLVYSGSDYLDDTRSSEAARSLQRCLYHFRAAQSRSEICARAAAILSSLPSCPHSESPGPQSHSPLLASNTSQTGSGYDSQDHRTSVTQNSGELLTPLGDARVIQPLNYLPDLDKSNSCGIPPGTGVDLNGWTASAELQDFFCRVPAQQWLSPSLFPWSDWNDTGNLQGTSW